MMKKLFSWILLFTLSVSLMLSATSCRNVETEPEKENQIVYNVNAKWPALTPGDRKGPGDIQFTGTEWSGQTKTDADTFAVNRNAAHAETLPYDDIYKAIDGARDYNRELSPYYKLLSGNGTDWKFQLVDTPAEAEGEIGNFYKPEYDTGNWNSILVPANWQTQGYDYPIYVNFQPPWSRKDKNLFAPKAPVKYNPVGFYVHTFDVPAQWLENPFDITVTFDGVESAFYLYVNGQEVGYSEDSYTPAEFNITEFLNTDGTQNKLALKVYRWSDGSWLESQDFIRMSGIFRDVYLVAKPLVQIQDYTVVTDFDGAYENAELKLSMDVSNLTNATISDYYIDVRLFDSEKKNIFKEAVSVPVNRIEANQTVTLEYSKYVENPAKWSAEHPNLYTLTLCLIEKSSGKLFETVSCQVGFREMQFLSSADSSKYILINGKPILFKGVNRHDSSAVNGRAVSKEEMLWDVTEMKRLNMNAVRTSHYPNANYWYYLCDKYGLYTVAEANIESHVLVYQGRSDDLNQYFRDSAYDRVQTLVENQKNRASVVMWSMGNECAAPKIMEDLVQWTHQADPTRPVHYEPLFYNGSVDLRSQMYQSVDDIVSYAEGYTDKPYILCEYAHAMGNAVGNLKEYVEAFETYDMLQGGFIWDWIDQGLWNVLKADKWDYYGTGYYLGYGGSWKDNPNDGSFCMNGIVSANRVTQPEGAEVRKAYQNFAFTADENQLAEQKLTIQNKTLFSNANEYELVWSLQENGVEIETGTVGNEALSIAAGETGTVMIPYHLPNPCKRGAEYFLKVSLVLKEDCLWEKKGYAVATEQLAVPAATEKAAQLELAGLNPMQMTEQNGTLQLQGKEFSVTFHETTGRLESYVYQGTDLLTDGIQFSFYRAYLQNDYEIDGGWEQADGKMKVTDFQYKAANDGKTCKISVHYTLPNAKNSKLTAEYIVYGNGMVKVTSTLTPNREMGNLNCFGMQMILPEGYELLEWYGRGPGDNYADRNTGSYIERYVSTVTDNFYPFPYPQDTGNKTDVRWISLKKENSAVGLLVKSDTGMEANALHFTTDSLRNKNYVYGLKPLKETVLSINAVSAGVGNASCGPKPLAQYQMFSNRSYTYCYDILPFDTAKDEAEISNVLLPDVNN